MAINCKQPTYAITRNATPPMMKGTIKAARNRSTLLHSLLSAMALIFTSKAIGCLTIGSVCASLDTEVSLDSVLLH